MAIRVYSYVGPADIKAMVAESPAGAALTDLGVLACRSEHVACAGGAPVLAAGEIAFA